MYKKITNLSKTKILPKTSVGKTKFGSDIYYKINIVVKLQ